MFTKVSRERIQLKPGKMHDIYHFRKTIRPCSVQKNLLVDPKKIEVIASLPSPTNVKGLRSFLGAATYHRRFIYMYAEITQSSHWLLKKEKKYEWTEECQCTFDEAIFF